MKLFLYMNNWKEISLHSYEKCLADKKLFAENFVKFEKESNKMVSARLSEDIGKPEYNY